MVTLITWPHMGNINNLVSHGNINNLASITGLMLGYGNTKVLVLFTCAVIACSK